MRISAKNTGYNVLVLPGSGRPIRLRIGGLSYCLDVAEAVKLATAIADAVTETQTFERTHHDQP